MLHLHSILIKQELLRSRVDEQEMIPGGARLLMAVKYELILGFIRNTEADYKLLHERRKLIVT